MTGDDQDKRSTLLTSKEVAALNRAREVLKRLEDTAWRQSLEHYDPFADVTAWDLGRLRPQPLRPRTPSSTCFPLRGRTAARRSRTPSCAARFRPLRSDPSLISRSEAAVRRAHRRLAARSELCESPLAPGPRQPRRL